MAIIGVLTCYPDMVGLGEYYQGSIWNGKHRKLKPETVEFLNSEIKRMALLNEIVAEILLKKRPRKSWVKDFEEKLLRQFFTSKKLKAMSSDEKKDFLVSLMFPKP